MLALSGVFKLSGDMVGFIGPMGISIIVSYVQRPASTKLTQEPDEQVISCQNRGMHVIISFSTLLSSVFCFQTASYVSVSEFFSNGYVMGVLIFLSALAQGTFSQSCTHLINVEGIRIKAALQVGEGCFDEEGQS